MQPKIDILMATYNGEQYLPVQLRSLQNQTYRNWRLLVHDDASTDATLSVLRDFAARDERIVLVEDDVVFRSAALNFLHLLQFSDSPFAIFCDHDDLWLENKLELLYAAISQRDNSLPQAVCCNAYMYDTESGDVGGYSIPFYVTSLKQQLFCNGGMQGCSVLFNAPLRDICRQKPKTVAMHDHLLTLAALTFGQLTGIPQRLMLYRRYQGTVTDYTDRHLGDRIRHFFAAGKTVLDRRHYEATKSFFELHRDAMSEEAVRLYEDFFRFQHRGRLRNAFAALRRGYSLYGRTSILFVKLLLRPLMQRE
ncbi:MAG: glycosyltransferase [Alloprevotella sp.]|nr:glycosyltransferase [Alloprevotella sp.]